MILLMKVMLFGVPPTTTFLGWVLWWGKTSINPWVIAFVIGESAVAWLFWFVWQPLKRRGRELASHLDTPSVQDAKVSSHALEFCLRILLSSKDCNNILNDLEEQFDLERERFGSRRARVLRACDLFRSLWPFATKAARKLIRWSAFASALEWVRRLV